MVSQNRRFVATGFVILGIMVSSGCATRKYVRLQTEALQPAIQEAINAAKENAERIDSVDRRAREAETAAEAADQKATQAQQSATAAQSAAQSADRKADGVNEAVQRVGNRVNTLETRIASINDNYAVSETQTVTFALNSSTLSEQAKSTLDSIASSASGAGTGYMIELQGFTDSTGSEQYNINLSQRRAQSVERYLVTKNVPLFRISIVGLGEERPAADNKTQAGRDQNRRVEVKILTAPGAGRAN